MPRREAFQLTVDAGATPPQLVSKRIDYLVMGVTDLRKIGETGKSTKHHKALALATEGHGIEIIDEDQFFRLIAGMAIWDSSESRRQSAEVPHLTAALGGQQRCLRPHRTERELHPTAPANGEPIPPRTGNLHNGQESALALQRIVKYGFARSCL